MKPLVLVVDDSEDSRVILGESLEFAGFQIAEARDGEEGLRQALSLSPAVILLDLSMPRMDGFEVARRLTADGWTQRIPIIAVSAYGLPDYEERAAKAGCRSFLQKPVNPHELVTEVCRVLGKPIAN